MADINELEILKNDPEFQKMSKEDRYETLSNAFKEHFDNNPSFRDDFKNPEYRTEVWKNFWKDMNPPEKSFSQKHPIISRAGLEVAGAVGGEVLGGIGGGAVGSVVPGAGTAAGAVAGKVAGGTAGYVAGSKIADWMLGENTGGLLRKGAEGLAFSTIPIGAAKVLNKSGRFLTRRSFGPTAGKKQKLVEEAVDTAIDKKIYTTEGGVSKATGMVNTIESNIDSVLKNSKGTVKVDDIVNTLEKLKTEDFVVHSSNPKVTEKAINKVIDEFKNHPNTKNGIITVEEAHKMKKQLYKEINNYYNEMNKLSPSVQRMTNTEKIAKHTEASALRESILNNPHVTKDVAVWLKDEKNLLDLLTIIQKTVAKDSSTQILSTGEALVAALVERGIPAVIASKVARVPGLQSWIGINAARAGAGIAKYGRTTKGTGIAGANTFNLLLGKNHEQE